MYGWGMKLERNNGNGLAIHSESKATGIPRARNQQEVGEELERKMWKEVEGHEQRSRSWSGQSFIVPYTVHQSQKAYDDDDIHHMSARHLVRQT